MQKKIAVINDLSGYGRCSLTVAIPVLSAMGHQCCPIPTAILSNHTEFPVYFFDDYTEKMTTYTDKWKELGLSFDAIATGFLGSEAQIGIVMEIVQKLKAEKTFVVVDPVMGDHGHAYETYTPEMCEQMKELVCMADVVLPNVTECCILTDTPYREENWARKELLNMAMMRNLWSSQECGREAATPMWFWSRDSTMQNLSGQGPPVESVREPEMYFPLLWRARY